MVSTLKTTRTYCYIGYGEYSGRYKHVFDFFEKHGFAVYGYDVRGHGKSQGQRGYFNSFQYYVNDLKQVLDERIKELFKDIKKVFVVGHSLGGATAAIAATQGIYDV